MTQHIDKSWHGIRQAVFAVRGDPDEPVAAVKLPVAWGHQAAAALASVFEERRVVDIAAAADAWIAPIAERAAETGISATMAADLHALLATRRGAPAASVWRGEAAGAGVCAQS